MTGRRISTAPSRRDDATLLRQSAVAAIVLGVLTLVLWSLALLTHDALNA